MRHSAPTRLCDCASFVLWLNCGVLVVLVLAYNILIEGWVFYLGMGGRILAVYDIMGHEGALYVPPSGAFLVLVKCAVELCVLLVLVYSLSL